MGVICGITVCKSWCFLFFLLQIALSSMLMMEYDSEDSELMPKVFAVDVDDDDVDLAVPPTSGQEYLRRVMWVTVIVTSVKLCWMVVKFFHCCYDFELICAIGRQVVLSDNITYSTKSLICHLSWHSDGMYNDCWWCRQCIVLYTVSQKKWGTHIIPHNSSKCGLILIILSL